MKINLKISRRGNEEDEGSWKWELWGRSVKKREEEIQFGTWFLWRQSGEKEKIWVLIGQERTQRWMERKEGQRSPCLSSLPWACWEVSRARLKQMESERLQAWRLDEIFKMLHQTICSMAVRFWVGGIRKIWLIKRNLEEKFWQQVALFFISLISGALGNLILWHLGWGREGNWNQMNFKVPSISRHSRILLSPEVRCVVMLDTRTVFFSLWGLS